MKGMKESKAMKNVKLMKKYVSGFTTKPTKDTKKCQFSS